MPEFIRFVLFVLSPSGYPLRPAATRLASSLTASKTKPTTHRRHHSAASPTIDAVRNQGILRQLEAAGMPRI